MWRDYSLENLPAFEELRERRLAAWRQTAARRLAGPDEGAELIGALGLVTLYPVTPEAPNLYHAYVGDPGRPTDSKWDSPSGEVYTWRWILGRREAACYTVVVRKRPTWIAWDLLPAILRLLSDLRMPDELLHLGVISPEAYRLAQALEEAERPLSTSELREAARFPTGKEQRAAYQKALAELDARLLLARIFSPDARAASDPAPSEGQTSGEGEMTGMGHTLFSAGYRVHVDAAERLTREQALDLLLTRYLPGATWVATKPLSRALGLPQAELDAALTRLQERGQTQPLALAEIPGPAWLWVGA
jgi:DNA-binding transcriptional ArsR family regulator